MKFLMSQDLIVRIPTKELLKKQHLKTSVKI